MEVAEQDGGLGAGDDEDDEDEEEEPVHVVDLRRPDGVEDEEELDEDAAEGQHAAHDDAGDGLRVHALVGDLARDLVRPHWVLQGPLPITKISNVKYTIKWRKILKTTCLNPKNAPTKVRGTETPNQRASRATRVKKGMAAELPLYHRTRFMTKKWANTTLFEQKQYAFYIRNKNEC